MRNWWWLRAKNGGPEGLHGLHNAELRQKSSSRKLPNTIPACLMSLQYSRSILWEGDAHSHRSTRTSGSSGSFHCLLHRAAVATGSPQLLIPKHRWAHRASLLGTSILLFGFGSIFPSLSQLVNSQIRKGCCTSSDSISRATPVGCNCGHQLCAWRRLKIHTCYLFFW